MVGGLDRYPSNTVLATADLFEPTEKAWRPIGPMNHARRGPRLVVLDSAKVLAIGGVAGGFGPTGDLASVEIYDPRTGRWSETASMAVPRRNFALVKLRDGRVLVCGGADGRRPEHASAEIYDPANQTWSPAGHMNVPRRGHGAILMPTGQVLIVGGYQTVSNKYLTDVEIFDPEPGS